MKKIILFILIILAVIVAIFAGILIFINKLTPETPQLMYKKTTPPRRGCF